MLSILDPFQNINTKTLNIWMKKYHKIKILIGNTCWYTILFAEDQILLNEYRKWGRNINITKTQLLVMREKFNYLQVSNQIIK